MYSKTIQECFDLGFTMEQTQILTGYKFIYISRKFQELERYRIQMGLPSQTQIIPNQSLDKIQKLEIQLFDEISMAKQGLPNKARFLQLIYSQSCVQF